MSIAKRPAMEDPGNGKEFIEGILIIFNYLDPDRLIER